MEVRVDLTPQGGCEDVVVVIDVLRSCTVAPLLFDNKLQTLRLCSSLRAARELAKLGGHTLLGERRGLPPEGFNYGTSPAELRHIDMTGHSAVLASENAPKSLPVAAQAKHVLLGSLYNAEAVLARALTLASHQVVLMCTGFGGHEDLDDALAAGYLAARLKQSLPDATLGGASMLAVSLLKAFPNPLEALWQSRAGHYLRTLELQDDLAVASLLSHSDIVPELLEVEQQGQAYRFAPAS